MLLCAQVNNVNVSKNSCIITIDTFGWLCVYWGESGCLWVAVPHPNVFWAYCFLYTAYSISLHITALRKKVKLYE